MYCNMVYCPRPGDYDRRGLLSNEALLQILETGAAQHSAKVNDSIADANRNGIAWILIEWDVRVLRRTYSGEKLYLKTWTRGTAPASTVFRDYILTDDNGSDVVYAEAKFALLDLSTSKLIRIGQELLNSYQPESETVFSGTGRLRAPSDYASEKVIALRRSDIDFNNHVHNTKYITYADEILPEDAFESSEPINYRIVYSKPVKANDTVIAKIVPKESGYFIGIYTDNGLCTMIEYTKWDPP